VSPPPDRPHPPEPLEARFARAWAACLAAAPAGPVGIAVSGGGDSVALLALAAAQGGRRLAAVSVDHGLRPEAEAEAELAGQLAAGLGIPHRVLRWTGWDGRGNLQAEARRARRRLIGDWAAAAGIGAVALGHSRDDQAETVLLRLLRGSGVDGLAGMAPVARQGRLLWLRPMLDLGREELRRWLEGQGLPWAEDPSNSDEGFARVRLRRAMAALDLDAAGLAATAARMATARAALEAATAAAADAAARAGAFGEVRIDAAALAAMPQEIAQRLLAAALCWVAAAEYRPRLAPLAAALAAALAGGTATLHGCLVRGGGARAPVVVTREPRAALAAPDARPGEIWDRRWRVCGPEAPGLRIAALGEAGLALRPVWRESGAARAALLAGPAVWRGQRLEAAPLLDAGSPWRAALDGGPAGFRAAILSH
jgi:tRNA(Ile)-lysidine synthase